MSNNNSKFNITPVAGSIPFDKDNDPACEFESEDMQAVIEEICRRTARSTSAGLLFSRSGNYSANAYLKAGTVVSNRTGLPFDLLDAELIKVFVGNEDINTFDITLYHHDGDGINLTSFVTISIVAARSGWFDIADFGTVPIPQDKQIACRITSGNCKNPIVSAIAKGDAPI